jgi:hypothetical protein
MSHAHTSNTDTAASLAAHCLTTLARFLHVSVFQLLLSRKQYHVSPATAQQHTGAGNE